MPRLDFFDTHCHLTYGEFAGGPDAAWARARNVGVTRAIVVGVDAADSERAVSFAAEREGLSATAGIHPNDTARADDAAWATVERLAAAKRIVALGETGLDFYRDSAPKPLQIEALERHAALALRHGLPLVLHCREAFPSLREVLDPWQRKGVRGVVHCFGGRPDDLHPFVDWGYSISYSGIITYPKAPDIREAARRTPLELCLIETDAPWLAPVPERGRMNEPAFVIHTAAALGAAKALPIEEIAAATTRNALRFFGLPD